MTTPEPKPIPRLDLAPKLNRPLRLWWIPDYFRLIYWYFFFPQAFRWYVDFHFPHSESNNLTRFSQFKLVIRNESVFRNLIIQILIISMLPLLINIAITSYQGQLLDNLAINILIAVLTIILPFLWGSFKNWPIYFLSMSFLVWGTFLLLNLLSLYFAPSQPDQGVGWFDIWEVFFWYMVGIGIIGGIFLNILVCNNDLKIRTINSFIKTSIWVTVLLPFGFLSIASAMDGEITIPHIIDSILLSLIFATSFCIFLQDFWTI